MYYRKIITSDTYNNMIHINANGLSKQKNMNFEKNNLKNNIFEEINNNYF